ncbi:response regulator [Undibacterium sp. Di24W]|uniref:response regulator n=1 Tax=Undibacterium sp. Di24W TaxID=3413033 RepID=UPI003BF1B820
MNLFIVEDSLLIQNRLVRFIEELPDISIVGITTDIVSAYDKILNAHADAMILDIQLRDGNGLVLLKKIKTTHPEIRVVVLSNHSNDANRMQALRAGADSFLDKSTDFEQIPGILHRWKASGAAH